MSSNYRYYTKYVVAKCPAPGCLNGWILKPNSGGIRRMCRRCEGHGTIRVKSSYKQRVKR